MLTPSALMGSASGRSMVQSISRQGTSYSVCRSPLASTERVVWKVLSPTFLPTRSLGDSMPAVDVDPHLRQAEQPARETPEWP